MLPYPRSPFGITTAVVYCVLVTSFMGLAFVGFCITGGGSDVEQREKIFSPDKKFALITNVSSGGVTVSDSCEIMIESQTQKSESKRIGYLYSPCQCNVFWRSNDVACVHYQAARRAIFEERFIELDKHTITVDVISEDSPARTEGSNR